MIRLGVLCGPPSSYTVVALGDSVAGAVSADVVHQLQSGPVAKSVARADFVILNVGANDVAEDRSDYDEGRCGGADGEVGRRNGASYLSPERSFL